MGTDETPTRRRGRGGTDRSLKGKRPRQCLGGLNRLSSPLLSWLAKSAAVSPPVRLPRLLPATSEQREVLSFELPFKFKRDPGCLHRRTSTGTNTTTKF